MKKKLIIAFSLIAVIFLALNILLFAYRYKCFVKVVNANSDCVEIPSDSRKIYNLTPEFRIDVQDYTKNDMINYTFDVTNNLKVIKNYSFAPSEVLENPYSKALIDKAMETAKKYSLTD